MGIGLLAFCAAPAWGQSTLHTIATNGPASNRVNLVFLSEGYTAGQLPGVFLRDATNAANAFFAAQPYAEYQTYFNVFAIAIPSIQSGSDHPGSGIYRDTYFNSTFDPGDYLISFPPDWADADSSHGQGKVDALLQTHVPGPALPVLLVSDPLLGGSDGGGKTAVVSTNGNSFANFLVHETGHVFGGLGDEYTTPYPGFPDVEEPNTTRETRPDFIKWKAWIATNTPIPTPPTFQYAQTVGLFEGAHYHATGWYRPKLNCTMGNVGVPFCEVCSETIVLSVYQRVRPLQNRLPSGTNVFITTNQPLSFSLSVLQPATHNLEFRWLTNGVAVAGETNSAFSILPQLLYGGTNTVAAEITDGTALVRNDPTDLLRQSTDWLVVVNLPELRLDSPRWIAPGSFAFRISGVAPQGFIIQASTNLANWSPVTTNSLVSGQLTYTNFNAGSLLRRYFRAVQSPL